MKYEFDLRPIAPKADKEFIFNQILTICCVMNGIPTNLSFLFGCYLQYKTMDAMTKMSAVIPPLNNIFHS